MILGLKKNPKEPYPIIEILGPIDIGKTMLGSLLSKRLAGVFFSFPRLDPLSLTGRSLLSGTRTPEALEANPFYWVHIYSAHLYEYRSRIIEASLLGPVITTNYFWSTKNWIRSILRLYKVDHNRYCDNLPEPTCGYTLIGEQMYSPVMKSNFSSQLTRIINHNITKYYSPKIKKINVDKYLDDPVAKINELAIDISEDLSQKFDLGIDIAKLYNKDTFIVK